MTSAAALAAALLGEIGDNDDVQGVTQFIPTGSRELNKAMSGREDGGFPFGRLVEVYGPSGAGKTGLATEVMVCAQKMGGVAGFCDWERSLDIELAKQGYGLNDQRPHWIYNKPKTWEEGNMIAAKAARLIRASKAIPDSAPIVWVFDSIASAIPQSSIGKQLDELNMNDTTALARVTSTTLKVMAQIAEETNSLFLYLNQIRLKPGVVYGDPTTTPGGLAMEYFSTVRLALSRTKVQEKVAGGKDFVGQDIKVKVQKSKLTKPFQEATLQLRFDEGGHAYFDYVTGTVEHLIETGKLKKPGHKIEWIDGNKYFMKEFVQKVKDENLHEALAKLAAS